MLDQAAATARLGKTVHLSRFVYLTQLLLVMPPFITPRLFRQSVGPWRYFGPSAVFFVVSSLVFLSLALWAASVAAALPRLAARPVPFTTKQMLLGFLVPVLNFYRPYQMVRALDASIDPSEIPVRAGAAEQPLAQGYRSAVAPEIRPSRPAPVSAWWIFFAISAFALPLSSYLMSISLLVFGWSTAFTTASYAVSCCGMVCFVLRVGLTIAVVHRVEARLHDRFDRLRARA